jgi:hypothetical protein
MIGLFSVFEVMKAQRNFMEETYDLGEYKLTWMFVVTFPILHYSRIYFIYIKHACFVTLIK